MMQEIEVVMPALKEQFVGKFECADITKAKRIAGEKGLFFELTFDNNICSQPYHEFQIKKSAQLILKASPLFSGITHWFHRGFFIDYLFKAHDGKTIASFRIDRESLFWKTFSHLKETNENLDYYQIQFNDKTLSFLAKDFEVSDIITPGMPMPHKYCDIDFKQESYVFLGKKITLSLSIIALSKSWSDLQQLNCINEGDFEIQTKYLPKTKVNKFRKADFTQIKKTMLMPVYSIIETRNENELFVYALSSLIAKHQAVYLVFSGPNDVNTKKIIDEIISSVKVD